MTILDWKMAERRQRPRSRLRDTYRIAVSAWAIWIAQTHCRREVRLDLLAKNQGHIASCVLQQLLARNTGLGAKLQTLHQVNERAASDLGRGCASQAPAFISCSKRFAKISADAVRPFARYERISVTR